MTRRAPSHLLATLGLSSALLLTPVFAVAAQHDNHAGHNHAHGKPPAFAQSALNRARATAATTDFVAAHKEWAQARGASNKAANLEKLIAKAEARREMMAELIEANPAEALRIAIPEDKQVGMPAEVLDLLEQRISVEGDLAVVYEDYEDGQHKLRHFVNTAYGERFELRFSKEQRKKLKSGLKVNATGLFFGQSGSENTSVDGDLIIETSDDGNLLLADNGTGTSGTAYDLPNAMGAQNTLVILVNFQDKPSEKPWTVTEANNLVFGTVNDFMQENSSDQTWVSGNTAGWFTIPVNSTECDGFAIESHAKQAAQAAGYNLSSYDRFVFAFPKNACGYSGMGQVGAVPSSTWINGSLILRTVAHELGHNMGLHHSHALECGDTTLGSSCTSQEYGDTLDIMGYSGTVGHFNAFQKEQLGWLSADNVINVTASGSHTLVPAELLTNSAKVLKVFKEVDSTTGQNTHYYVEFRQPIGFDTQITDRGVVNSTNIFNGVIVHQGTQQVGNSSYLLDMTPGSEFVDMKDPALTDGFSFTDSAAGITLTTESTSSSQALVSVDFSGGQTPTCTYNNPGVSVTPGTSDWVEAGTTYTYTVTVSNNNSSACSSSTYDLSKGIPSGWSAVLGQTSLNIASGSSASTTITLTSPTNAANGFYDFSVSAASGGYSATDNATYVVNTVSNSAPTAQNDTATTNENTAVTISVLSNDTDPDGDSLSVTSVSGVNGSAVINSNGTITFTPANGFSGTEVFSYSISDGNGGSDSASVSVTVNPTNTTTNSAPIALSDSAVMSSITSITVPVLNNDYDPDGDSLTVTGVTQGNKGSVRLNSDGTLTYTPAKRFKSGDSFSYTISDGAKSASATVTVQLQESGGDSGGKGNGKKR